MNHNFSVFRNSCLNVPVDPISKMPKSAHERKAKPKTEPSSVDSCSIRSATPADVDAGKLKEFYHSIPDYNDINHLPPDEFYSTLKLLREKKKIMLGHAIDHIDDFDYPFPEIDDKTEALPAITKTSKSQINTNLRRKYSDEQNNVFEAKNKNKVCYVDSPAIGNSRKLDQRKTSFDDLNKDLDSVLKVSSLKTEKNIDDAYGRNVSKPKRIHSACSITWDSKLENKDEIDRKFDDFFDGRDYSPKSKTNALDDDFTTRSMPSSPLRNKKAVSQGRRRKSVTVPKPFKMTERDEDERMATDLRCLQKSFSDDMLHQKRERKAFRARPVPIESRIPLYDKILEDQAMRRAITKINSEAELRAQMKPFNFTKREEKGICAHDLPLPKPKKKKKFRARPVPKNLFSNYIYEKRKEDEFFRTLNRRIRAEEMLRNASLPGSMAHRERSRQSTPAAHSDLPVDPSPVQPSESSSDRRTRSPVKGHRRMKKQEFITTSPQPFRLNTADRAAKKMEEITKKIYQESKSATENSDVKPRAYSALDLRAHAAGRSNLAALLRAEAVRRQFEMEKTRRLTEMHRRNEMRARDRALRSKPAWHLVKNNHEEDIAMRLQTRRDEERMRREEFLHEMELMYSRVQQQPMLFERYYAPKFYTTSDSLQLSPRKVKKCRKKSHSSSRKVSINDGDGYNGDVMDYLNRLEKDGKLYSDSEAAAESSVGVK